jgi:hypothetical protein
MQDSLPHSEVAQSDSKSKSKIGTKQLCNTIAYCLHPENIDYVTDSRMLSMRKLKYKKDLRIVRNKDGYLKWVLVGDNKELTILRQDQVRSTIACAFASFDETEQMLSSKDYDAIIASAQDKAPHLDALAACTGGEKFILDEETEIKDVRFKSDEGFCYKRLPFDPDPFAESTIWESEFLPRITHNKEMLLAWIGSLFDYASNRERYVWLHGEGNSGKSTLVTFLIDLFCTASCTGNNDSIKDQWFVQTLLGKRLCAIMEAESNLVNNDVWKRLTGEKYLLVKEKYKNDRTEKVNIKFIVASNYTPSVPKGNEFKRRLLYVKIEKVEYEVKRTVEEVQALLLNGAPWFIYQCIEAYNKNKFLEIESDHFVDMLQEDDNKEQDLHKYFILDPHGIVSSTSVDNVLQHRKKHERDEFKQWLIREKNIEFKNTRLNGIKTRHFAGLRQR